MRSLHLVAATALLAALLLPAVADAKPGLLRLWLQGHGTVASGQGNYFDAVGEPRLGYGGQVGIQLIVFEAFFDVNVFDLGRDPGEQTATMWNQIGAGIVFPIQLHEKVQLFARANATYAFAPFGLADNNRGYTGRAGGGIDFFPVSSIAIGAAAYGGYHVFGSRTNNDNGRHVFGQLYTRFDLGF